MPGKTHWRKIIESDYLAGADLDDGQGNHKDIVVTIREARSEKVRDVATSKEEVCLILTFQEQLKPMICNVTNAKAISKRAGSDYIQDWTGLKIQIGTEKVKAFGEVWDALRIRPFAPRTAAPSTAAQPAPTCADCNQPIPDHEGAPARNIAASTNQKYGRPLCYDCAQKAKAAMEKTKILGEFDPMGAKEDGGEQLGIGDAK